MHTERARAVVAVAAAAVVLSALFAYSGVLGIALTALVLGGLLFVPGWKAPVVRRLLLGFGIAVIAYPLVVFATFSFLFGGGPVGRDSWPGALSTMTSVASAPTSEVKVVSLGGFIDSAYAWRLPVARDKLASVVSTFGLSPVAPTKVPPDFRTVFPLTWRPPEDPEVAYYSTPDFPATDRGSDGDHYFAAYDRRSQQLYVWLKANF